MGSYTPKEIFKEIYPYLRLSKLHEKHLAHYCYKDYKTKIQQICEVMASYPNLYVEMIFDVCKLHKYMTPIGLNYLSVLSDNTYVGLKEEIANTKKERANMILYGKTNQIGIRDA